MDVEQNNQITISLRSLSYLQGKQLRAYFVKAIADERVGRCVAAAKRNDVEDAEPSTINVSIASREWESLLAFETETSVSAQRRSSRVRYRQRHRNYQCELKSRPRNPSTSNPTSPCVTTLSSTGPTQTTRTKPASSTSRNPIRR